jgi:hypothetical protein
MLLQGQKGLPFTDHRTRKGGMAIPIDVVAQAPTIVSKPIGKYSKTVEQFVSLIIFNSYLNKVAEQWLSSSF